VPITTFIGAANDFDYIVRHQPMAALDQVKGDFALADSAWSG
jgi:hypothetical protein